MLFYCAAIATAIVYGMLKFADWTTAKDKKSQESTISESSIQETVAICAADSAYANKLISETEYMLRVAAIRNWNYHN